LDKIANYSPNVHHRLAPLRARTMSAPILSQCHRTVKTWSACCSLKCIFESISNVFKCILKIFVLCICQSSKKYL